MPTCGTYFTVSSVIELFKRVDNHTIFDFIKETHFTTVNVHIVCQQKTNTVYTDVVEHFVQNEVGDTWRKEFVKLSEASSRQMGREQFWGSSWLQHCILNLLIEHECYILRIIVVENDWHCRANLKRLTFLPSAVIWWMKKRWGLLSDCACWHWEGHLTTQKFCISCA